MWRLPVCPQIACVFVSQQSRSLTEAFLFFCFFVCLLVSAVWTEQPDGGDVQGGKHSSVQAPVPGGLPGQRSSGGPHAGRAVQPHSLCFGAGGLTVTTNFFFPFRSAVLHSVFLELFSLLSTWLCLRSLWVSTPTWWVSEWTEVLSPSARGITGGAPSTPSTTRST